MEKGTPEYKWKFAIGTTSRVPNSDHSHYLIADIDAPLQPFLKALLNRLEPVNIFIQRTERGWHVYTDFVFYKFSDLILMLHKLGADKKWLEIAVKRGYLFLADKSSVVVPWPVERMVLSAKGKK